MLSSQNANNISLESAVTDRLSFEGPGIDGQLPHHIETLFRRGVAKVVLGALGGKWTDSDGTI